MNKKGTSIITVFFLWIVFFILYAMFFGQWLTYWCIQAVNTGELGAVESFLILNLNIIVVIAVLLSGIVMLYFGE